MSYLRASIFLCLAGSLSANVWAYGPAYNCQKVAKGSVEDFICKDQELTALDQQLTSVYAGALRQAANEQPPVLKAEQRGWIKGRNDCWKSDDKVGCVRESYQQRIAELQARYRLVKNRGPFVFNCEGNPLDEITVNYFDTQPATLIAERGDSVSLMYAVMTASGTRYIGRNESFWEHQGQAVVTWGYATPEMLCVLKKP